MLNPLTDWTRFRWPRAITMGSQTAIGVYGSTAVANAFRGKCSYRIMQATNGAYVRPEATYLIPKDPANTGGAGPWKPGDRLTDANEQDPTQQTPTPVIYTVQLAENDEFYWLLAVFNPKICFNLRDLVDIVPLTESVSTILTRNTTDGTVVANQVCRRQPQDLRMATLQGRQGDLRRLDVFFAVAQTLSPKTHILRWTEGASTILADIVSVTNAERIDELQRVTVEVRP